MGASGGMSAALVALYAPYCPSGRRAGLLEQALQLLPAGRLQGERRLRPEGCHRYALLWRPGVAPQEPAQLQLQFQGGEAGAPLEYSVQLPTHQLVCWLMDWIEAGGGPDQPADLPESFWQWLLLGREPTPGSA